METAIEALLQCSDCGETPAKYFNPDTVQVICSVCRNSSKYMDFVEDLVLVDIDGSKCTYLNALDMIKDVEQFAEVDDFGQELQDQAIVDSQKLRGDFDTLCDTYIPKLQPLTDDFPSVLSSFQSDLDNLVSTFVNEAPVVGMAGMKYLADYDKYNVTEAEIDELRQKNQEQQMRNEEAE